MRKSLAIISLVSTVIIIFSGFLIYANGKNVEWFGISISPGVFGGIVAGLIVYDVIAMKNAFTADKKIAASETVIMARTAEKNAIDGTLAAPCIVTFSRQSTMVGCAIGIQVYLNGTPMTVINNGQTISMTTFVKHNEISVHYTAGNISRSFEFEAIPGGNIHIHLKYVGAKMSIVNQ